MPRIVKSAPERRAEIIETAQRLFLQKGYEQTSVNDITDDIGIAKGTFYHHFSTKLEVLDALINVLSVQAIEIVRPIVEDSQLSALEKFNQFLGDSVDFKGQNREMFQVMMPVWYGDDNAIWRERTTENSLRQVSPLLAQIIAQGMDEGTFTTSYAQESAEIILQIGRHLSDSLARRILAAQYDSADLSRFERLVDAHEEAIARVLGTPVDAINLIEVTSLIEWFLVKPAVEN